MCHLKRSPSWLQLCSSVWLNFSLKLSFMAGMDPQSVSHPTFPPPHRGPAVRSLLIWKWGRWTLSLECAFPQCQLEFLSWDVASTLPALSCVITHTDLVCLTCQAAYCPRVWAAWILVTLDPFSRKETTKSWESFSLSLSTKYCYEAVEYPTKK